jgi:ParB family chromosome partitioning protein
MSDEKAAEWLPTASLVPWGKNPRRNEEAIQKVADSIRRFGFGSPIVARREDKRVIAGHTRLKAAKLLGLKTVPVRLLDVSERDADLLALADNKLGEIAEWDDEAVAKQLSEFSFKDVQFAGWDWKELGKMANELAGEPDADAGEKLGGNLTYSVIVECADEDEQTELLDRFEREGLRCKPLVT